MPYLQAESEPAAIRAAIAANAIFVVFIFIKNTFEFIGLELNGAKNPYALPRNLDQTDMIWKAKLYKSLQAMHFYNSCGGSKFIALQKTTLLKLKFLPYRLSKE